jgi:hypothetical protein
MAIKQSKAKNAAYAGVWTLAGRNIQVFYIDRPESRRRMALAGGIRQSGHPLHIRTGWRWIWVNEPDNLHGPFSSSRIAYRDAMARACEMNSV